MKAIKEGQKRWQAWMDGAETDPDLVGTLLFAAARFGGTTEFDAMFERYQNERVPQVKNAILGAMGRFREAAVIEKYHAVALTPAVRPQDMYLVLAWGMRNRDARDATWKWLRDNWDLWIERYGSGGHMLEHFPLFVGSGFATHEKAAEIKDFFATHPHPALGRPTAQAVEAVEIKADWFDRDKDAIREFLNGWQKQH
jgi:puromycin-sensitive aminopeptidase